MAKKTTKETPTTLEELITQCDKYIDAIYRLEIMKDKKTIDHIEWKITSSKLSQDQHFENGKFRFIGETLQQAMECFFNYLKSTKKI